MKPKVIVYSKLQCPYCVQAKQLLERKGVEYEEVRIDLDPARREEMLERSQRRTVPQIFINDYHVGGCDDLHELERNGQLDKLLAVPAKDDGNC